MLAASARRVAAAAAASSSHSRLANQLAHALNPQVRLGVKWHGLDLAIFFGFNLISPNRECCKT